MSTHDDPYGFDGFEFVELVSPEPDRMGAVLEQFGFVPASRHRERHLVRYKQGRVNLLLSTCPRAHATAYCKAHGSSVCGLAYRVADAARAHAMAVSRGAKPVNAADSALGAGAKTLEGIGGTVVYLVDRHGARGNLYDDWDPIPGAMQAEARNNVDIDSLDHVTHDVDRGHMKVIFAHYSRVFGFLEQKYFITQGQHTGMINQAIIAPDGAIRLPMSEGMNEHSQVAEFVRNFGGDGIQHLALASTDIYATVEKLRSRGVEFQTTGARYYQEIGARVPHHNEDVERLKQNDILIDGDAGTDGLLLQIFTQTVFGMFIFEIIQRKGNLGFGDGNAKALFESIERDQIERGVLKVGKSRAT